jgi:hypothetical protein
MQSQWLGVIIVAVVGLVVLGAMAGGALVLFGSLRQSVKVEDPFQSARQEICAQLTLKPQGSYATVSGRRGALERAITWTGQGPGAQTWMRCATAGLSLPAATLATEADIDGLRLSETAREALRQLLALGDELTLGPEGIALRLEGEKLALGFLQKRLLALEDAALKCKAG